VVVAFVTHQRLHADPDATLQALIPAHLQLRSVIQTDLVPLNDANQLMCLSYHLHRGCWAQCKRAQDHNRRLSAAERQRVVNFITAQLRKLLALNPPPASVVIPPGGAIVPTVQSLAQGSTQGPATHGAMPSQG
jgi:hypothetical protein